MIIIKYCPWCDYWSNSLAAVHQHMDDEHAFLAGARPPDDPRYTITFEPGKLELD